MALLAGAEACGAGGQEKQGMRDRATCTSCCGHTACLDLSKGCQLFIEHILRPGAWCPACVTPAGPRPASLPPPSPAHRPPPSALLREVLP